MSKVFPITLLNLNLLPRSRRDYEPPQLDHVKSKDPIRLQRVQNIEEKLDQYWNTSLYVMTENR